MGVVGRFTIPRTAGIVLASWLAGACLLCGVCFGLWPCTFFFFSNIKGQMRETGRVSYAATTACCACGVLRFDDAWGYLKHVLCFLYRLGNETRARRCAIGLMSTLLSWPTAFCVLPCRRAAHPSRSFFFACSFPSL